MSSLILTFRYLTRPFLVLCECFVDYVCPLYFIFWLLHQSILLFNLQKITRIGTNMKFCIKTSKHIV
jgi:hypothetical protein